MCRVTLVLLGRIVFAAAVVVGAAWPALPASAREPAEDRCRVLARSNNWAAAAACVAQSGAPQGKTCDLDGDLEWRGRILEQDGRLEPAAALWQKAALRCTDEAQLVRTRRANALAQVESAIDLLLAGKKQPAALALQTARRDFELQQDPLRAQVPGPLRTLQTWATTGKGSLVRRIGGDVPETVVQLRSNPTGGLWLLTRADYGPAGGKIRLRRLDAAGRERRALTTGQTGNDVPSALDVAPDGQLAVVGTTTGLGGAHGTSTAAWLCRPPLHAGPATFVALAGIAAPQAVLQTPTGLWLAARNEALKPTLVLLDSKGRELQRWPTEVAEFGWIKGKPWLREPGGALRFLSPTGPGKAEKRAKSVPTLAAAEAKTATGVWRATVENTDDVAVVLLTFMR